MSDEIGSIRDAVCGDVMTLGRMYKTDDAAAFLRERVQIPDMTASRLTKARKRGEIVASVFGQSVVYAERDLLAWVAALYGNSKEHRAAVSKAMMGNRHGANKKSDR